MLTNNTESQYNIDKYYTDNLEQFHKLVLESGRNNLNMVVGISIKNPSDHSRRIMIHGIEHNIDIGMSCYNGIDETPETIIEGINSQNNINWYQLNINFNTIYSGSTFRNQYIVWEGRKESEYPICKPMNFSNIIFDGSTAKFLQNLNSIAYFYYCLLKVGGTLYLEQNDVSILPESSGGYYKSDLSLSTNYYQNITIEDCNFVKASRDKIFNTWSTKYIMENNAKILKEILLDSEIEIKINDNSNYPLKNCTFEVKNYYIIKRTGMTILPNRPKWTNAFRSFIFDGLKIISYRD
jgi:hypothetical protein